MVIFKKGNIAMGADEVRVRLCNQELRRINKLPLFLDNKLSSISISGVLLGKYFETNVDWRTYLETYLKYGNASNLVFFESESFRI